MSISAPSTDFFRYWVNDRSFIRGAARLLVAPLSQPFPTKISDIIALAPVTAQNDEQTVSEDAGVTGGTFTLTLDLMPGGASQPVTSGPITDAATAAEVQAALVAMSNIGAGNVACTGGPLPGTPVLCTFQGALADTSIPTMIANSTALVGGSAHVAHTQQGTPALALFDAMAGWGDLGATKNGITISINNAEETFDIDQQLAVIDSRPSSWTVTVGTSLAESTPERMQIAWEGSAITLDNTPTSGPEQEIGFGAPNFYIKRRLAVLYQRPSGLIRGYFFRITQRSPQESTLVHNKTGEQQSIPALFNVLPDTTISDVTKQFFIIRDQSVTEPVYT